MDRWLWGNQFIYEDPNCSCGHPRSIIKLYINWCVKTPTLGIQRSRVKVEAMIVKHGGSPMVIRLEEDKEP